MAKSALEALRAVQVFEGLTDEQLQLFLNEGEEVRFEPGEMVNHAGDRAEWLSVILEGELRIQREGPGDAAAFTVEAGEVTGLLPFSRMTIIPVTIRAVVPTWCIRLHKDRFDGVWQKIPELVPRLVGVMSDRIRFTSRVDQQRDKLSALGKLSAGLAHEMNNPASAARRAAQGLKEGMARMREASALLQRQDLTREQRSYLASLEKDTIAGLADVPALDSLDQSDREDEVTQWLESKDVKDAWKLSPALVEAGFTVEKLEPVAEAFGASALGAVLQRLACAVAAERLVNEIESSTGRISDLVKAIKEYSYMDRNPEQEIDIHQGIDSTLTMLKFRLKNGVQVIRDYDPAIPKICAHGSELNQVWTNLIDNAVDAMKGQGELKIVTRKQLDRALIEIIDSGAGIPSEMQDRIFEPFFTTKGVGEGTGLGLDTVYRIVRNHHGEVTVESKPGRTVFQVWLPFHKPKESEA